MSEAPFSPQQIKELLSKHVPPDPVALSMLPEESREFLCVAPKIVKQLLELPVAQEARLSELVQESKNMAAALELYANNSGDVLFSQNLELCLRQVTAQ